MIYDELLYQSILAGSAVTTLVSLILFTLACAGLWRIFNKAGEPGFAAIIPFYNTYKLFKIAMGNGWLFLFLFIPILNVIAGILLAINLGRAFHKGGAYAVGIFLLPSIFYIILGFSGAQYYGPKGQSPFNPDAYDRASGPVTFTDLNEDRNDSSDYVVINTPNVQTTKETKIDESDLIDADKLSAADLEVESDTIIDVDDLTVELTNDDEAL